jgi:hypothetical protein
MAGAGIQSLAKLRAQMCAMKKITVTRIATVKSLNLTADCHRPDLTACIPGNLSAELAYPQSTCERFAKKLLLLWQFEPLTAELSK